MSMCRSRNAPEKCPGNWRPPGVLASGMRSASWQGPARAGRAAAGLRRQRDLHAAVDPSRAAGGRRRTRRIWSCRGRSTRPGSRSTTSRPALGRGTTARLDPNLPLALRMGRKHLDDALGAIDRYLEKEPSSSRRPDFENRAPADRRAGRAAGRRRERAGDGRGRRRSEGAAGVREPLRDADPQPQPDAAAAARRERPDRAAAVGRRGDGALDGDRARRGGAGGGGRGVPVHAADAAAAVGAARPRAAAGGRRLRAADGRDVAATRSAIWRASSTRWRTRSRSASSG